MAVITVALTLLALPIALIIWSARSLSANKAIASKVGFPVLVRWVSPINPFWMVFGSTIVRKCRALGIATENFSRFYLFGWEATERYDVHAEYGDVFMLATPGGNWCCVADAGAIHEILARRQDFRRDLAQFEVLNVYGKNLSTTDDEEWQKHRKLTAITFTEKNNELVWCQSLAQAEGMLSYWINLKRPIWTTNSDTKIWTLNVLAAALFNKNYPFEGPLDEQASEKEKEKQKGEEYQYRDSLSKILGNIVLLLIFGANGLKAWWTPESWKAAGEAVATFRTYVTGLINEEKEYITRGVQDNHHLVAALVRASETGSEGGKKEGTGRKMTLTEEETISNLFVYAFAGNDTTAISLTHILVDLAAHPEVQDWIAEEIHHYLPDDDITEWTYATFPKLKRCLAVVMEALRLTSPLGQLVKTTGPLPRTLKVRDKTYTIPANTAIHCNTVALHTDPSHWGPDAMSFRPQRFISTSPSHSPFENEVLAADTSTNFLPWAEGQRVCPGKKFSQVEIVAALAVLFRKYRLMPERKEGETLEQAQKRIWETGLDQDHEGHILHEMRDPGSIGLVWRREE